MRAYTLEEYNKSIELNKKNLGSLRISKLINISRSTIEGWINNDRKPYFFSEKRINAQKSKENLERLKKLSKISQPLAVQKAREKNIKPIKNESITKELAYVLGVILGDGHVSQRRVILSATDKDFVITFKNNLEKWSGYKTRFFSRFIKLDKKIKNRKIQWVNYLDSVKIEYFIKNFNYEKIKDDQNKISFIKGFFDSEGHFSKDYELIAYNKDITKLNLISSFLSDLGLENKINTYTTKNINGNNIHYSYLKIIGKSRYLFYQKIGFSIQRKQRRLKEWIKKIGKDKYGGK